MTFYYILAGIILVVVIIKIRGKNKTRTCGPFCRFPKSTQTKKKTYSEELAEIRKRIEEAKKEQANTKAEKGTDHQPSS